MAERPSVLFVCLGNICRSPLAQAAFLLEAMRIGLGVDADSAGTGPWHIGDPPDGRAQAVALANGVDMSGYRGRQLGAEDFDRFSHVVALDRDNLEVLRAMRPQGAKAQLSLLLDHVHGRRGEAVADPYYGEASGFARTWSDVSEGAAALARKLSADKP